MAGCNDGQVIGGCAVDSVMTVHEAAEALGVTRQRVHALLKDGAIIGRKSGGTWLIDRASVERRQAKG